MAIRAAHINNEIHTALQQMKFYPTYFSRMFMSVAKSTEVAEEEEN